jgi:hypothetical protein
VRLAGARKLSLTLWQAPEQEKNPLTCITPTSSAYQKKKAASEMKNGLFQIWLHRVDEFLNCFLYENIFETNPQFQAVELALAGM